jgi:hypothetical protein
LRQQARWTVLELGSIPRGVFFAALIVVVITLAIRRTRPSAAALIVGGWVLGCWLLLATSGTHGTGFGLPVLTVVIVAAGAVLASLPPRGAMAIAACVAAAILAGIGGELRARPRSLLAAPIYRMYVAASGASPKTNVDEVHAAVGRIVGDGPVLLVRDDAVLNANGMAWTNLRVSIIAHTRSPAATRDAVRKLSRARVLITGESREAFRRSPDQRTVEAAARQRGFALVSVMRLGRHNVIRVWQRRGP